jgi:multidrug resistance efflux pump
MDQRLALHHIQLPRAMRVLARLLVVLLVVAVSALVLTPWQQNITGAGRLIAFNPEERTQQVEAPVDGRIVRWHVVEGATLRRGDPIVELTDNDPSILQRLQEERAQVVRTVEEGAARSQSLDERIVALEDTLRSSVAAADLREQMAKDRVVAAEQSLAAARAAKVTADLNQERQRALVAKGLTSTRSVELADLEAATRAAEVDRAVATLNAARSEAASMQAELQRARADARARVDEARAALASARSDVAKARAETAKMEVRLARQQTQRVTAPVDGTVLRILARQSGELLKAGTPLAVIVPTSRKDVVELWVNGNDMPMVMPGHPVRLQFEGWPALQFSGWPSIAVGTFGGRVQLVDQTDNGKGKFRVLVEPDPSDDPWPSKRFLRQGVRANGWVLLSVVPVLSADEPSVFGSAGVADGKGDAASGGEEAK